MDFTIEKKINYDPQISRVYSGDSSADYGLTRDNEIIILFKVKVELEFRKNT